MSSRRAEWSERSERNGACRLRDRLGGDIKHDADSVPVKNGQELGVDPDAREALAFAFLAWAHLHGIAGNIPSVTGAEAPRVLGSMTPGGAQISGAKI